MRRLKNTFFVLPMIVFLCPLLAQAQTSERAQISAPKTNIIVSRQTVRFVAPAETQEARLEIYNAKGELIFDSGVTTVTTLDWLLADQQGQPIGDGPYSYRLTAKLPGAETPEVQRGQVFVAWAKPADRVWVTGPVTTGIGTIAIGAELTVSSDSETISGGTRFLNETKPPSEMRDITGQPPATEEKRERQGVALAPVEGSGTPGQIPLWNANANLGDSILAQGSNGNIGIGTKTPYAKLTVAGVIETNEHYGILGNRVLSVPGPGNTFVGLNTGIANQVGASGFFFQTGVSNSFIGSYAGRYNTTGYYNTFLGSGTGRSNTTGDSNTYAGAFAGFYNTSGYGNSFFGFLTGYSNRLSRWNSYFGSEAGYASLSGDSNVLFGAQAGYYNSGSWNILIGVQAGYKNSGSANSFVGDRAGFFNTSGAANSFFGSDAGAANTIGRFNSFLGSRAGQGNTTGEGNVFIGFVSGVENTEGGHNTYVGSWAGGAPKVSYATAIGSGARVTRSNSLVLGREDVSVGIGTSAPTSKLDVRGDVYVADSLYVTGSNYSKTDHPGDPETKYLLHAAVQAPELKNLYDGNVTTDADGEAVVTLPDYCEALNTDFRYQLTVVGSIAQAVVLKEIADNRFTIKTDRPQVKVSWLVIGTRNDPTAQMHRLPAVIEKPADERGTYLNPAAYRQPPEKGVNWRREHPDQKQ